jgi:small subunit ribosomal protein S16
MLAIRLQRVGRKHEPIFRLVVTDSKNSTKSGRILEIIGSHDPRHKTETVIEIDRVKHWMSVGAKPSDTVHNMLVSKKIIEGKKINVLPKKRPIKKEAEAVKETPAAKDVSKEAAAPKEPEAKPAEAPVAAEAAPAATPAA